MIRRTATGENTSPAAVRGWWAQWWAHLQNSWARRWAEATSSLRRIVATDVASPRRLGFWLQTLSSGDRRHPSRAVSCGPAATNGRGRRGEAMSNTILSEGEREYALRRARELPAIIDIEDLPRWISMSRATIIAFDSGTACRFHRCPRRLAACSSQASTCCAISCAHEVERACLQVRSGCRQRTPSGFCTRPEDDRVGATAEHLQRHRCFAGTVRSSGRHVGGGECREGRILSARNGNRRCQAAGPDRRPPLR
jgi:hypothetical protein